MKPRKAQLKCPDTLQLESDSTAVPDRHKNKMNVRGGWLERGRESLAELKERREQGGWLVRIH